LLDIGIAQVVSPGEVQSGDRCIVQESGDRALIGVIDGVGHGPEAALAAEAARAALDEPADHSVGALMMRCHERLQDTRGAAMTLMSFDARNLMLEWSGVGNVAAVLLHPEPSGKLRRTELFVRGGVAGLMLPSIAVSSARFALGDMVVAATDGVHSSFADNINRIEPPQQLAERLLARYQTGNDDALVVVANIRWRES
jgi:negative regulator of sigma-B (phosphoserine phosphatase)